MYTIVYLANIFKNITVKEYYIEILNYLKEKILGDNNILKNYSNIFEKYKPFESDTYLLWLLEYLYGIIAIHCINNDIYKINEIIPKKENECKIMIEGPLILFVFLYLNIDYK